MNSPQEWNWNILLIGRCSWCESNYHRLRWQLCWIMKQINIFLCYHMYFLRTLELLTVYRGNNIKKLWLKLNEALDFVIYTWSKCDRHLFTPLFFLQNIYLEMPKNVYFTVSNFNSYWIPEYEIRNCLWIIYWPPFFYRNFVQVNAYARLHKAGLTYWWVVTRSLPAYPSAQLVWANVMVKYGMVLKSSFTF